MARTGYRITGGDVRFEESACQRAVGHLKIDPHRTSKLQNADPISRGKRHFRDPVHGLDRPGLDAQPRRTPRHRATKMKMHSGRMHFYCGYAGTKTDGTIACAQQASAEGGGCRRRDRCREGSREGAILSLCSLSFAEERGYLTSKSTPRPARFRNSLAGSVPAARNLLSSTARYV